MKTLHDTVNAVDLFPQPPQPDLDPDGIGVCSTQCPYYDGALLGSFDRCRHHHVGKRDLVRPTETVCRPWVVQLVRSRREEAETRAASLEAGEVVVFDDSEGAI